jgi:signal transduction histidine kinase
MRAARRAARALATLAASMRVRLTLWYLAILALVFLVFNVVLIGELRQNDAAAQHALLAKIANQAASAYNPSTGLLDVESLAPPKVDAKTAQPNTKPVAASAYLLPGQAVALFTHARVGEMQAIGSLSPAGVTALQAYLINGASGSSGTTSAHVADTYGEVSLPIESSVGVAKSTDYVLYSTDVISQGQLVGTLTVGLPNAINQTTQAVLPALLLAGPITLLVAALGGYWLASRALRPVRLITRAAQQISETDLSARLRLKRRDELGELAATFDHMLTRLEAAFQQQRQFTADASHELRTPLTIINLEVTRALAQRRTPEEYEQALGIIQAENLAMSRLVGDLLTLARADASPLRLHMAPVDLSDVTLEAVERLAPLARQRGVALVVEALPEVRLMGDRAALTQALVNLVENGVKYTAGVGSSVRVTTCYESTREGDVWAVARIADDGPGIAPEHLPHLFDRFYRADTARTVDSQEGQESGAAVSDLARDGHGLGLAIAQWVAQAHGGALEAQSAAGAGASFELRLPALVEAGKQKPLVEESSRGAG